MGNFEALFETPVQARMIRPVSDESMVSLEALLLDLVEGATDDEPFIFKDAGIMGIHIHERRDIRFTQLLGYQLDGSYNNDGIDLRDASQIGLLIEETRHIADELRIGIKPTRLKGPRLSMTELPLGRSGTKAVVELNFATSGKLNFEIAQLEEAGLKVAIGQHYFPVVVVGYMKSEFPEEFPYDDRQFLNEPSEVFVDPMHLMLYNNEAAASFPLWG